MDSGTPRSRMVGGPRFGLDLSPRLRVDAKVSGRFFLPESGENRHQIGRLLQNLELGCMR